MLSFLLLGVILVICLLAFIACIANKETANFCSAFGCIGGITLVLALFNVLDMFELKLRVAQATSEGEAKVQALRQEAVKLGLANFKATQDGKEVMFIWVNTNPIEKPLTSPKAE